MTAIWKNDGEGWELAASAAFALESKLHDLVEEAPHLLPLAGSPNLVMLGREVLCGSGYADLIAVEPEGRLVIIEVKLASNAEARRAVVSQVLAYAAALRGISIEQLDSLLVGRLPKDCAGAADAVAAADQNRTFDRDAFMASLEESLSAGRFRLVLVLDSAPADLVRLVGYLEALTDEGLLVDLITVAQYQVGASQILVPQRIEPEAYVDSITSVVAKTVKPVTTDGSAVFMASIDEATAADRPGLQQLAKWAAALEERHLVRLFSTKGTSGRTTLVPRLIGYDAGLVTIANDHGPVIWMWRTVFDRFSPNMLTAIETKIGEDVRQGTSLRTFDEELLGLLTKAHETATVQVRR